MKIIVTSSKDNDRIPEIDIEVFVDHPLIHVDEESDSEIAAAVDLSKYNVPKGPVISRMKDLVFASMEDDFESFVEMVEDLCEEDYGLILTYKNANSDHSHYYNYLVKDENNTIIATMRIRLRISNHPAHKTPDQRRHKKEELESPKLRDLLTDEQIRSLGSHTISILVNDKKYSTYDDAFEEINRAIERAVNHVKSTTKYKKNK